MDPFTDQITPQILFLNSIMTVSFEGEYARSVSVSPDSTFHEAMGENESELESLYRTLSLLQRVWNNLDMTVMGPHGNSRRRIYINDMLAVRQGSDSLYYSLGGEERQRFALTFLTLSRRVQDLFIECSSTCLHENRFMNERDISIIVNEASGKRFNTKRTAQGEFQREAKKQKTCYPCFG